MQEELKRLREELTTEAQELLANLRDAVRQVREDQLPEWNEISDVLVEGVLRLTQAALGRELQSTDDQVTLAVQAALKQVAASEETVVHLNPADAEVLEEDAVEGVTIVADPSVAAGGVTVVTPTQRLRQDLPSALEAAEEVLRS
nr:FliH/SctL family protein [Kineosporia babensis]